MLNSFLFINRGLSSIVNTISIITESQIKKYLSPAAAQRAHLVLTDAEG